MIIETGRVVAVETDGLWVETIQRSTCGNCAAQKGCGQSLLARLAGHTSYLRVVLEGRDPSGFQMGEQVRIGVPEQVVVTGSLFVYLVPLMAMLVFSSIAHNVWAYEGLTAASALVGLLVGGAVVRWRAQVTRNDPRLQPVLLDDTSRVTVLDPQASAG